ncbi:MAG: adenylate/guanylate cyclase domain-containing protein [Stellaceae bacterium]
MAEEPQPAILLVDDDENNRYTLSRRLKRENYTDITEAENGRKALELLRERPFDLILLDIMMPEMDGYEMLGQLKSDMMLREIPVIMISAVDGIDSVVRCIELGAEDYLPKPFNPVLLKARIGASLEKRRADDLLHSMLPPGAVRELKATNEVKPRRYEEVAVLFCDVVDFTSYCDKNPPEQVIAELQTLIEEYERIVTFHGMEKIKTIGDALLATAGLLQRVDDPLVAAVRCGIDLVEGTRRVHPHWGIRVGVHHGPVVAGIVGRQQFLFDLWGDTVNTAARIAAAANVNSIFMSSLGWMRIRHRCQAKSHGSFELKGKGRLELVECLSIK